MVFARLANGAEEEEEEEEEEDGTSPVRSTKFASFAERFVPEEGSNAKKKGGKQNKSDV